MATNEEILPKLAEIVNAVAGVPVEDIQPDKSFIDDLDIDSLGLLTIATEVEERLGVILDDSAIPTLPTVGALVDLVADQKG